MAKHWPWIVLVGAVAAMALLWWRPPAPTQSRLVVYSYSSFAAPWGAGRKIKALFEERCHCLVEIKDVVEGALILNRLLLERDHSSADVVVGLDRHQLLQARRKLSWRAVEVRDVRWSKRLPGEALLSEFVPFDWAPLSFVYRTGELKQLPRSLSDLLSSDPHSIVLEDPRSSSVGLQFLLWMMKVFGEERGFEYLRQLKPHVHSVSASWSAAYGIFKKGLAPLVFSYATSPVYHWQEEQDHRYQALALSDGHPVQVEYAAVVGRCRECGLAEQFVRFLLEPEAQRLIMNHAYMQPMIEGIAEGSAFAKLPDMKLLPLAADDLSKLDAQLPHWLERWGGLRYQ